MINFKFCAVLFLLLVPRSGSARLPTSVELCSGTALSCTQNFQTMLRDAHQTSALYDVACADRCSTLYIGHRFLQYIWAYQVSTSADGHRRRRRTSTHRCREVHTFLLYDVYITHYNICRAIHAILNPSNYNILFKFC